MTYYPGNNLEDQTEPIQAILWRSLVFPGHEYCRLFHSGSTWALDGTAVFSFEQSPCKINYYIVCDADWRTQTAQVEGYLGSKKVNFSLRVDSGYKWWLNEVEVPDVKGCIDLDLNFSPSTNTLPIRRLKLSIGEQAEITAAWLRFPSFDLEPLPQRYYRLERSLYRYESGGGSFVADLRLNDTGFVQDYPGVWQAEATSS